MGIGPIIGIRPLTIIKPFAAAPDLSGVFAAEFRTQQQDEYSSRGNQRARRGLEDEEPESESLPEASSGVIEEDSVNFETDATSAHTFSSFA